MFTDEELKQMMESTNEMETIVNPEQTNTEVTNDVETPATEVEAEPTVNADVPAADTTPQSVVEVVEKLTPENSVSVSDIILSNVDKHIKMILINSAVTAASADADVTNYIVYVNTDKKIPCIYDCEGLRIPNSSVKNADGTWKVTSIEGRRSGFVIKCGSDRDLVMTKNFIYDCEMDATGKIVSVKEYNRKNTVTTVTEDEVNCYDEAVLFVRSILPKIVKCGKYTTLEDLRTQVKASYDSVNDINAMFKIVNLRLQIGC